MHGVQPAPKANEYGAEVTERLVREMDAPVLGEDAYVEDAEQVQSERDDERAADPCDPHAGHEEHTTEYTCGSAERDEYE